MKVYVLLLIRYEISRLDQHFNIPELAGTLRRRTARFCDTSFTLDLHEDHNVLKNLEHWSDSSYTAAELTIFA